MTHLSCNHEEADTRIALHVSNTVRNSFNKLLVVCRDTDVLLLLLHFVGRNRGVETWMLGDTSKQRKCYPVHRIAQQLSQQVTDNILGFRALTGSDTSSLFTGFGKKKCWKFFKQYPDSIHGVGRDGSVADVEEFLFVECIRHQIYGLE